MMITTHFFNAFHCYWRRTAFAVLLLSASFSALAIDKNDKRQDQTNLSVNVSQGTLHQVLTELSKQSGFNFVYSEELGKTNSVTLQIKNTSLDNALKVLESGYQLRFEKINKTIAVSRVTLRKGAEQGKVSGKVTDEKGQVLPGASIRITKANGTNADGATGTTANEEGAFVLSLSEGTYSLEASFVGYQRIVTDNIVVPGGGNVTVNFTLQDASALNEVTVTYGKQKSKEVTGSITQINADALQDMPVMQFAQQLQGRAPGVQISQTSGQPGRGLSFRIRGAASLFSDAQPLFVVDGMPVTGSINNINPSEIESFSILKDASATALYGSRAANGVILITTKHAKPGDSIIEFNANYGIQKIPENRVPKTMNATQFAQFMKERYEDRVRYEGLNPETTPLDPEYQNPESNGVGTNWFKVLTRTAPIQSYDLTIRSAREKSSSAVIAGYQEQQGVLINNYTKLFSIRLNQDLSLSNNRIKIGFNIAPSYRIDHNNRLGTDGVGGLFEKTLEASPLFPHVNPDGSMPQFVHSPGMVSYLNPYAQFMLTKDDYITTRILGNTHFDYEFLDGLSFKTNVGIDKGAETRSQFSPSLVTSNSVATGLSSSVDNYSWTAEANLQYTKTLFNDHNIDALLGYSAQKFNSVSNSVSGTGFPSDDVPYLSAATVISAGTSNTTQYSLLSQIARVNYNYKSKYLLSGAVRRDGSSKFGADRKYGFFPSVSAGWVVSDEAFMQAMPKVNLLKLRASYGITGNNFFGNFVSIANLGEFNYILNGVLVPGRTVNTLGNSDLSWERNKQFNVGMDLGLFNDRVMLTYDYYNKITDGLIQDRPIPRASGFTTIKFNVGVFKFWGHEIGISTKNLTGPLTWNSNLNVSFDRNIIKSLVDPGFIRRNNTVTSDYYRQQAGQSLGAFYGFIFDGLYKDEEDLANSAKYGSTSDVGTVKMRDLNGDGKIDDVNDRTFIGDPTPDFTFGFINDFTYKNFDLSMTMSGAVGGEILTPAKWAYSTNMDGSRLPLAAVSDRWRSPENPGSGVYPRTKTGTTAIGRFVNTQWIEDGSYLTMKNIALGYTVDMKGKLALQKLRVYASVQQAFILTKFSGMNPEISFDGLDATKGIGIDENAYPVPRTFSLGVSMTFK